MKWISVMAVLVFLFSGCKHNEEEKNVPVRVKTINVKPSAVVGENVFSGTIEEQEGATLSFAVSGTMNRLMVSEGQSVSKGKLLASVDDATLQQSAAVAEAALQQAEDAYVRLKQLHDNNSLPEIEWTEVQSKLKQARAAAEISRKSLADALLHAPFSGVVAEVMADAGQNIAPGMPVLKIVDITKVKAKISVPEAEIGKVTVGMPVNVSVGFLDDRQFEGVVCERGVVANPLSRSYEVKVLLDNADRALMPGMLCEASIIKKGNSSVGVVVPVGIVQLDSSNKQFVWIVADGKAKKRYVEISGYSSEGVIVISGLRGDERIIAVGQQKVSEGMRVSE